MDVYNGDPGSLPCIFYLLLNILLFHCCFVVAGLAGLVQAYQSCIQSVQLYGPTNISPIINHVAHFAQQAAQTPTATVSNTAMTKFNVHHLLTTMQTI